MTIHARKCLWHNFKLHRRLKRISIWMQTVRCCMPATVIFLYSCLADYWSWVILPVVGKCPGECESICFSLDCDVDLTWTRPPTLVWRVKTVVVHVDWSWLNYKALRVLAELKHSQFLVIFTAMFVPKKNTPKICASFSAEKIKGRKIKNDFFSAKNENEIWSASKFDNGLYGKSLLWQIKQVNKSTFLVCGHCGLLLSYVTPEVWCLQGLESKELQPR